MAAQASSKTPAVVCAENIALLYMLHDVPLPPSKNKIDSVSVLTRGYILSFEQERKLAGALSFLLSISDNPNHVAAVCIEEDHSTDTLRVLLAINKRHPDDGHTILQTLKNGVESVMAPLARLGALPPANDVEEEVFRAIVAMCQQRILCRMRLVASSNTRKKPKPPFRNTLQRAVDSLQRQQATQDSKERGSGTGHAMIRAAVDTAQVIQRVRDVMRLVDAWVQHQVPRRLRELIASVCRLHDLADFGQAINALPNCDMEPSTRKNLLNITQKIAQYRQVARFLCRTATAVPMVRRARIILVNLPPAAFQKTNPGSDYCPDISSKIAAVCGAKGCSGTQLDALYRFLKKDRAVVTADFVKQARKTRNEAKIHAEIQLLIYCYGGPHNPVEAMRKNLPPRIVRSNKDACFLCDAFIRMHGKMYTSRCHGRLYPGWRLPHSLGVDMQQSFNRVLEQQIRNSVATLKARKEKTEHPPPNESTLTTLPSWTSDSSLDITETEKAAQRDGAAKLVAAEAPQLAVPVVGTVVANSTVEHKGGATQKTEPFSKGKETMYTTDMVLFQSVSTRCSSSAIDATVGCTSSVPMPVLPSVESSMEPTKTSTKIREECLQSDDMRDGTLPTSVHLPPWVDRVREGTSSRLYDIHPFAIQIEYERGPNGRDAGSKALGFRVQQLPVEVAERLHNEPTITLVDVDELRPGEEALCVLDNIDCLYLATRNTVFKIALYFP